MALQLLIFASGCGRETPTTQRVVRAEVAAITIRATGCGLATKVGAGFAIDENLVVTVAHTLRGAKHISATDGAGREHPAVPVVIDHRTDIAILRLSSAPSVDSGAAVFAAPQVGRATIRRRHTGEARQEKVAVTVSQIAPINIEEPIDKATYQRRGFVARSSGPTIAAGDSGSPVLNANGAVVGMVFATDTATGLTAYGVSATELRRAVDALPPSGTIADTGDCPD
jgi:S1-C subfamily serine protease